MKMRLQWLLTVTAIYVSFTAVANAGNSDAPVAYMTSYARGVQVRIRGQLNPKHLNSDLELLAIPVDAVISAEMQSAKPDLDFLLKQLEKVESDTFADHPMRAELIHTFRQHLHASLEKNLLRLHDRLSSQNARDLEKTLRINAFNYGYLPGTIALAASVGSTIYLNKIVGADWVTFGQGFMIVLSNSFVTGTLGYQVGKRLLRRRQTRIFPVALANARRVAASFEYDCTKSLIGEPINAARTFLNTDSEDPARLPLPQL